MMRLKGHARKGEKSQIALEFIIVYSFVLVIFLVIFALIAAQRASTLSAQQFSSLELITQNIATNIDHALAAGSGYTATIPIVGSISALPYNLYLSSTGVVLANMTIGKQVISAEAYSSARSISVNATFQSQTANGISVYNIPVYTGTMRISNSRGTIYIDQAPVTTTDLPASMSIDNVSSTFGANMLNGHIYSNMSLPSYKSITLIFNFLNTTRTTACASTFSLKFANSWSLHGYIPQCNSPLGPGSMEIYLFNPSNSNVGQDGLPNTTTWEQVAIVLNASNNTLSAYQNGNHIFTFTPSNTLSAMSPTSIFLSRGPFEFSNVQLYGSALNSKQIRQLYRAGIGTAPIKGQNISLWLPLNGNLKDYSGNGNAASIAGSITYTPITEINLHTKTGSGIAANTPVGAVSSFGSMDVHLSNGHYLSDANGTINAFVTSNSSYGMANVTINGFNGNLSTVGNLVAWFPLDLGYGNTTYSMVNNLTGTFVNPSWAPIPGNSSSIYAGAFDGSNSIVNTTFSVPHAASGITISAWVDNNGKGNYWQNIAEISGEPYTHETLGIGVTGSGGNAAIRWSNYANTFADQPAGGTIAPNTWYLVTGVWSGFNNTLSIYVNGKLVATGNGNDTGLTSIREINIGGAYPGMNTFNGSIANVQVYNSSLSPAQVQSLYAEGMTGTPIGSSGLQAWYPLDGNAQDYSIYDHATSSSNTSFVSQKINTTTNGNYKVASFNGDSSITINVPGENTATGGYNTAAFWIYDKNVNTVPFSISSAGYGLYLPNRDCFGFDGGGGNVYGMNFSNYMDKYTFVVAEFYNGNEISSRLYIDGKSEPLSFCDGTSGSGSANGVIYIGGNWDLGTGYNLDGYMTNVQIYNTALTQTQVQQLYMQGLPFYKKLNVSV